MQNIKTVNPNKLVKEQYMHNHIKSFFKKISLKDRFKNIKATSARNMKGKVSILKRLFETLLSLADIHIHVAEQLKDVET